MTPTPPDSATVQRLRANPAVAEHAPEVAERHGFDPLSGEVLTRVRGRHRQWQRLNRRQLVLAVLFGLVAAVMVYHHVIGLAGERPIEGDSFWMLLAINILIGVLCGLSALKVLTGVRRRNRELAGYFAAYGELENLARRN